MHHHACEQLCKALAGQRHTVVLKTPQTMIWTSAMARNAWSRAVGRKGVLRIQVAVRHTRRLLCIPRSSGHCGPEPNEILIRTSLPAANLVRRAHLQLFTIHWRAVAHPGWNSCRVETFCAPAPQFISTDGASAGADRPDLYEIQ